MNYIATLLLQYYFKDILRLQNKWYKRESGKPVEAYRQDPLGPQPHMAILFGVIITEPF